MTKIRFNRLLSVVLALAMLATMMSFVFTANAADVSASVYEDLTYTTWPALGIDSNSTNANSSSADARYSDSKVSCWGSAEGAVLKVYGSKTFDLSHGFSFDWKMGLGYNDENRGYHCNLYVGDLHFLLMNGSTLKLTVQKKGATTKYIDATALANKGFQAFSISVTADGKLSVAVNSTEIAQTNIDVSALDFSNVSFDLISWFGYSGAGCKEGCIFEDPTLTVKKVPTTEAKKSVNVNNWTDLGLATGAQVNPNAITVNDTKITGKGNWYLSGYGITATEVFDLSGGFTFKWSMGDGGANPNTTDHAAKDAYNAISIGGITIASKRSGASDGKGKVYVIKNEAAAANNSNRVISALYGGDSAQLSVFGQELASKTDLADANNVKDYSLTVSADGKLSLDVAGTNICSGINVNVDDFSDATFSVKSGTCDCTGGSQFTSPSLTYYKTIQLVDKSVSTWTDLGLANAETFNPTMVTVTDNAINGANGTWDGAGYGITASEEFDLSNGFTFTWSMGDNGYSSTEKNNSTKNAYNAISIGGITVASQRSGLGDGKGKVYVIKNEAAAADNSNRVIGALWWQHHSQVGVYGSVLASQTDLAGANNVKDYSLNVSADGKLSLTVAGTIICSDISVSNVDFSAATFSVKSGVSYAGGSKYTNPSLTYKKIVKLADNFVVTKDGQGFVKCNGKNWIDRDVAAGTPVTLTAEAAYGYTFQGWVNGVNNTVVSTDPTLTVRANTTNNYTAVFVKNSGTYTVTVLNRFGKVIKTQSVAAEGKYTLPAAANVTGYTFKGWQVKDSEDTTAYAAGAEYTVTGNVIFVPVYDVAETPTTYNINVTGGTADKANANYNELVTVTATVDNFGYWTKNGVVVSYSSTYSFYAGLANGNDINLVAVADTASAAPVTSIVNVYGSTAKVTFLMERSVPDDYSLVESGFILAKADFGTTDYMSAVNGSTVIKVAASNTSANGQYMLNVKTTSGNAIYAVSYVTYVDASGKLHTVYSSAASANAQ